MKQTDGMLEPDFTHANRGLAACIFLLALGSPVKFALNIVAERRRPRRLT
jgi:hypothetical protein